MAYEGDQTKTQCHIYTQYQPNATTSRTFPQIADSLLYAIILSALSLSRTPPPSSTDATKGEGGRYLIQENNNARPASIH